jgi:3,4-dihydroxy 2-butanone 4-phosphate synthase/GTP cyclohydrolase II
VSPPSTGFNTVEEAIREIATGRMVVVVDDRNRESEGCLVLAAGFVSASQINFMTRQAGGMICLALTPERCDELDLPLMKLRNQSADSTPFTVTIDAREGVMAGISTADQAHTMRTAIDPDKGKDDIVLPGHVHPLRARPGGVLERAGHPEASVDLARLAGLTPAAVICEIQNQDGSVARVADLRRYCERHQLSMITIADVIAYRRRHEKLVERVVATAMPLRRGKFIAYGYRSLLDDKHHVAMVKGEVAGGTNVLARVHFECLAGDVFHALHCECAAHLEASLTMIERAGAGVLLYLSREGRGIGLLNTMRAYKLQEAGSDTVTNSTRGRPADLLDYASGAQILADLGVSTIRLLTDNFEEIDVLEGYGVTVTAQVPIGQPPSVQTHVA